MTVGVTAAGGVAELEVAVVGVTVGVVVAVGGVAVAVGEVAVGEAVSVLVAVGVTVGVVVVVGVAVGVDVGVTDGAGAVDVAAGDWIGLTRLGPVMWRPVSISAIASAAMAATAIAPPAAIPAAKVRRSRRYSVLRRWRSHSGSAARRAAQLLNGAAAMPRVGTNSKPASNGPLSVLVLVSAQAIPAAPKSARTVSAQLARSACRQLVRSLVFGVRRKAAFLREQGEHRRPGDGQDDLPRRRPPARRPLMVPGRQEKRGGTERAATIPAMTIASSMKAPHQEDHF